MKLLTASTKRGGGEGEGEGTPSKGDAERAQVNRKARTEEKKSLIDFEFPNGAWEQKE